MFYREFSINPETAAEVTECQTIEGMRRRIHKYARHDAMTRSILDMARYRGLSGDDTMTMLAFEALRRLEHMERLILDHKLTHIQPMIISGSEYQSSTPPASPLPPASASTET